MRRKYRYENGILIEVTPSREYLRHGQVVPDITPFKSPVDGTMITSRAELREHNKRHGVMDVGDQKEPPKAPPRTPLRPWADVWRDSRDFLESLTDGERQNYMNMLDGESAEDVKARFGWE